MEQESLNFDALSILEYTTTESLREAIESSPKGEVDILIPIDRISNPRLLPVDQRKKETLKGQILAAKEDTSSFYGQRDGIWCVLLPDGTIEISNGFHRYEILLDRRSEDSSLPDLIYARVKLGDTHTLWKDRLIGAGDKRSLAPARFAIFIRHSWEQTDWGKQISFSTVLSYLHVQNGTIPPGIDSSTFHRAQKEVLFALQTLGMTADEAGEYSQFSEMLSPNVIDNIRRDANRSLGEIPITVAREMIRATELALAFELQDRIIDVMFRRNLSAEKTQLLIRDIARSIDSPDTIEKLLAGIPLSRILVQIEKETQPRDIQSNRFLADLDPPGETTKQTLEQSSLFPSTSRRFPVHQRLSTFQKRKEVPEFDDLLRRSLYEQAYETAKARRQLLKVAFMNHSLRFALQHEFPNAVSQDKFIRVMTTISENIIVILLSRQLEISEESVAKPAQELSLSVARLSINGTDQADILSGIIPDKERSSDLLTTLLHGNDKRRLNRGKKDLRILDVDDIAILLDSLGRRIAAFRSAKAKLLADQPEINRLKQTVTLLQSAIIDILFEPDIEDVRPIVLRILHNLDTDRVLAEMFPLLQLVETQDEEYFEEE